MINPSGLVWWQPLPQMDMQIPYIGRAIGWQHLATTQGRGIVWARADRCDPDDPFDLEISRAVLLDLFSDAYPTATQLRRRGCSIDAWQVHPVDTSHQPLVDGAVVLAHPGNPTHQVLVNQDLQDPRRVRSLMRWATRAAFDFSEQQAEAVGWQQRSGKWQRTLYAHPCFWEVTANAV